MEFLDLPTMIIIVIAVFILLRLRSVLGQRTGHQKPEDFFGTEKRKSNWEDEEEEKSSDNVVKLPNRGGEGNADVEVKNKKALEIDQLAKPRSKLNRGLKDILAADPGFSPKEFLSGAGMAYEMIVNAFADGDKRSLQNLLSREVYEGFEAVIDSRTKNGETVKSSFVGIDASEIHKAELQGSLANVTVRFESQIISATFDKAGTLIEGDESEVVRVTDIWTFSRDTRSRDPNWKLIATEAEG